MTALIAFHGDPAVRDTALERLDDCIARGAVQERPMFWDGSSGSPLGCLLHSDDVAVWTEWLGLPAGLAMSMEFLAYDGAKGALRLKALISSISAGADASGLAGQMVVWLLDDVIAGLGDAEDAAGLIAIAQELRDMQADASAGAGPMPQAWRAARGQAMAQTKAMADPILKAAAQTIEAAAWDAGTAGSTLCDTQGAWMNWQMLCAGSPTPAELIRINDVVQEVDAALRDTESFEPELFRLLELAHPGLPAKIERYRAHVAAMNPTPAGRIHDALIAMALDLPVPAPTMS